MTQPTRSFGHKARIGNQISNLREELLEKQHDDAISRKASKKGHNKIKKGGTKYSEASEDEEEYGAHTDVASHGSDIAKFDAGLSDFEEEEPHEAGDGEKEGLGPALPDVSSLKDRMMKAVTHLEKSLKSIRGNEPTPDMFDSLTVFAYGTAASLSSVAQVVIVSPTLAKLTCYDPDTSTAVRDAIRDAGMNLNPRIEEGEVVVPIPKVSAETRKVLVKQIGQMGEKIRSKVRTIRRTAHDIVKKGQAGKLEGISKDDAFRVGREVEAVTEEAISMVNEVIEKKQQSIMAV